jgi:hypothetical protein
MKMKNLICISFVFACLHTVKAELPHSIANDQVTVNWNGHDVSINKTSEQEPMLNGVHFGADSESFSVHLPARTEKHHAWGNGKTIVHKTSGGHTRISVFEGLPFVVIQKRLVNATDTERVVEKVDLFQGGIDLSTPLRSASSAGLHNTAKPSAGYGHMAIGDPKTHRGIVCGWLTHDRGSGIVFSDPENEQAVLRARIDYGDLRIPPGAEVQTETLLVGIFDDVRRGLEIYADTIAAHYQIKLPEQPVFYMTWYNGGASDENRIKVNAAFIKQHLTPYGLQVVQIDDHWQAGISANGPKRNFTEIDPRSYPSGMKATADHLHAMNLVPGIWYMPFAGTWNDPFWADKQDLMLKQGASPDNVHDAVRKKVENAPTYPGPEETPFEARWGGTCLDLTNPKTLNYVHMLADLLGNKWGYKFFKMDGLWTGTGTRLQYVNSAYQDDDLGKQLRKQPAITPIEAYRNGLKAVRKATQGEVFLLGCSSTQNMRSYGASYGLVDAMRVGPDNGAGRNADKIVQAVAFASRNYFQEERIWFVDPDSFAIRNSVDLIMTRSYLSWITLCGMLSNTSVNYPDLSPERIDVLRRTMPSHRLKTINPVDFLENEPAKVWTLKDTQAGPERTVVGLFSWNVSKPVDFDIPLSKLGLDPNRDHVGFDYWNNAFVPPFKGSLIDSVGAMDGRILSIKPVTTHPQVLGTSRHITQGSVDLLEERWDANTLTLSGRARLVAGDPYELRIAVPWQTSSFRVVEASGQVVQKGPKIRVTYHPTESGEANWSVRFEKAKLETATPPRVRKLAVEATYTSADLTWDPAGNTDLLLTRTGDGPTVSTRLGTAKSYQDRTVELGKTYTYQLSGYNWLGEASEPATAKAVMPDKLKTPPIPPKPDIPLANLKWLKATSGWGKVQKNKNVAGKPLLLDGATYKNGIGAHAKSVITYDVPKGAKRFVAVVGVDDSMRGRETGGTMTFRVVGSVREMGEDPVIIGESPLLSAETIYSWAFNLELDPRFKELRLEVDETTKDVNSDHANWCDAGFLKK